ncbi:hypothetical protein E3N88_12855 [Mikania micrantha]|uniref:Uncharacterized protein n=1 Tax=Mikania micrantha TaxID=192012 RepID=A0A5N6P9N2_9ASTR|nr:hypothetical protein E3N88_12855 [Mikania micrantha]
MSWCRTKLWNQPQEAATTSIVDTVMGAEDDEYSIGDEDEFNEDDDLNGAGKSNLSSSLNMGDGIAGRKEKMDSIRPLTEEEKATRADKPQGPQNKHTSQVQDEEGYTMLRSRRNGTIGKSTVRMQHGENSNKNKGDSEQEKHRKVGNQENQNTSSDPKIQRKMGELHLNFRTNQIAREGMKSMQQVYRKKPHNQPINTRKSEGTTSKAGKKPPDIHLSNSFDLLDTDDSVLDLEASIGREGLNWDGTDQNVVSTWGDGWDWIRTYLNINYIILSAESRSEVGYYLIIGLSIGGLGMQVVGWWYCAGQIWVDFIWAGFNLEADLNRWLSGFKGWGSFSGQGCEGVTDGKDKCLKSVDFQFGQPITIKGWLKDHMWKQKMYLEPGADRMILMWRGFYIGAAGVLLTSMYKVLPQRLVQNTLRFKWAGIEAGRQGRGAGRSATWPRWAADLMGWPATCPGWPAVWQGSAAVACWADHGSVRAFCRETAVWVFHG